MSRKILVGTRKGLFTIARNGNGKSPWRIANAEFLGDNISMFLQDSRDGSLLAALDHGHFGVKMQQAPSVGAPWEESAAPAYPEKPEGVTDLDPWGKEIPWTTVRVWALETGGPDERGIIWCGTIPGGLFRSEDSGKSWEFVRSLWVDPKRNEWMGGGADLPGIHSICVDPRNSKHVRIAISCGGVWMTEDGGANWHCHGQGMRATFMPPEQMDNPNIQDAHRLVQCQSDPDHLWIQHHNGIYRSTNGGLLWEEVENVSPSSFGFAVVVHPSDPNSAWFVPGISDEKRIPASGKLVVTRTRDGGESFTTLSQNLPQEHAYDIVYRHGLDVSETGDELVFGTTTGGLWISEDQGDSWQSVSQNLPPVHCVRFVAS